MIKIALCPACLGSGHCHADVICSRCHGARYLFDRAPTLEELRFLAACLNVQVGVIPGREISIGGGPLKITHALFDICGDEDTRKRALGIIVWAARGNRE